MTRETMWILYHDTIVLCMNDMILLSILFEYYYRIRTKINVSPKQWIGLINTGMIYACLTNISIQ